MNTLSIKRMGLLMQYYWRTEKKVVAVAFLTMMICYLGMQILNALNHQLVLPSSLLYWILVCMFITNSLHYYYLKKESSIGFYTLPASNLEKFLSRVLYVTLGVMLLTAVAELLSELITVGFVLGMDYLAGNPYNPKVVKYFISENNWIFFSRVMSDAPLLAVMKMVFYFSMLVLPVLSVFTLSALLFRRWGFFIGAMLVLTFLLSQILFYGLLHGPGVEDYWKRLFIFFAIVTVVCYGLSYRSFCRQQMRKRWIYL